MQAEGADESRIGVDRTLSQIARGLTWVGAAFLISSAAVIVWAVFRTVGVDDLVVALAVAGLGLGLPAIVAFAVAWILNSLGQSDADSSDAVADETATPIPSTRAHHAGTAWGYAVAVLACIAAWALRAALDPLLGERVIYAPLLLAVAFTAWYGGLGPSLLATLLGCAISWYAYPTASGRFGPIDVADAVQLGLYVCAALSIGAIASALRASRERAQALMREVLAREAGLEKTRAELAAERDRSQVTLQAIADAVIATDAQSNVTFLNDGAVALTGWRAAESIGKPLAKIVRTLDASSRRALSFSSGGGSADAQSGVLLVARDGSERIVDAKVNPISAPNGGAGGLVLVFRDMTGARRAQAALEESEARFRTMADETPVMLWMCDTRRAYTYVNRSWLEFTGHTVEQEAGDGWTAGIHPEDFGPRQAAFAQAFEAREPFTIEYRLRRRDGEYRSILDHGAPRFDGSNHFAGYIGACLDITERRQAEATIGDFKQRKSAFLASLAHELRNPLAPIRSSIELLHRMSADADPRVARAHDIIDRQCARLAELVDDLLDLSRIDSGSITLKRERIDVAHAVERAIARHAAVVRDKQQELVVEVPRDPLRIVGDPDRAEQAIAILVGNAIKFTQQSGRIRVAAAARDGAAEIVVADNGPGIDRALQPQLFDLFDRHVVDRNAPQGLATGLAIVVRLARLMNGSLDVRSEGAGKGSTFTLRFPLAETADVDASARGPTDAGAGRRARILVVDDNIDAAEAIATLLGLDGYDVATAHDPDAAMREAIATDPDIVLLDIGLPGMTGYELVRKLAAQPGVARARFVALTGYGQPADTEQAQAAGFSGYLVKPVDLEQLREKVEAILAEDRDAVDVRG